MESLLHHCERSSIFVACGFQMKIDLEPVMFFYLMFIYLGRGRPSGRMLSAGSCALTTLVPVTSAYNLDLKKRKRVCYVGWISLHSKNVFEPGFQSVTYVLTVHFKMILYNIACKKHKSVGESKYFPMSLSHTYIYLRCFIWWLKD